MELKVTVGIGRPLMVALLGAHLTPNIVRAERGGRALATLEKEEMKR